MKIKDLLKRTLVTSYDNCDKFTLLEWLKCLANELDAKQLKITKANEGEGITLTFNEDGTLKKISANVTEQDIADLNARVGDLEIEIDKKQRKISAGENITIYYDEETDTDVINAIGGGGGIDKLVSATYDGEGYIVQTTGLYSFVYSFYGQNRRLPNIVIKLTSSEIPNVANETILFTNGERVRISEQVYEFKFYSRVESNNGLDAYYYLNITDSASTLYKRSFDYQPKTDNGLTTESKEVVGGINEHDIKINTHTIRLNGIDTSLTQLDSTKQNKTDNNLQTSSKNVVGAINEVNAKAEGGDSAFVISTANGKNPNFVSDNYSISASQIELQDGTIILIADIPSGKTIYVLEEGVSDRWYSGNGNFIRLQEKTILTDYERKEDLDTDVDELGYIKSVSFSDITGSATDNTSLQNALLQKENKTDLDNDVYTLGYIKNSELNNKVSELGFIKGITHSDLEEIITGSQFISIDYDEDTEKLIFSFDFTDLDEFIEFAEDQDIVASWTDDDKPLLELNINNTLKNKINNSLQLPLTHTEETLVGVDTTGAQEQVGLDSETMEIVNGKLKSKQEQSDWTETDTSKPSFIKNKPNIPSQPHLFKHNIKIMGQTTTGYNVLAELVIYYSDANPINTISLLWNRLSIFSTPIRGYYLYTSTSPRDLNGIFADKTISGKVLFNELLNTHQLSTTELTIEDNVTQIF